ncbi:MAG: T9SS type A sorting domain-containing protein [Crocinitomicaceae bacterium]|nr:T9SS type A sorting domain-containing protein [Crocinitomicaceae bacterium]
MNFIFSLPLVLIAGSYAGQQTIYDTIEHNAIERDFILYVPNSYNPATPAPLIFNFHGYTSNALQQMWYGDFRAIADTAGFIIAHPNGTIDGLGNTHFNVGWGGSSIDDVDFTNALIDSLSSNYNIDQNRIYSTGMSNGGFMSFLLACELSNRIAAVASVTGSIAPAQLAACNPQHPTPVLQIHGDSDGTVPYNGGAGWSEPVNSVLSYWSGYNNCLASPVVTNLPDIDLSDGSTVKHYLYKDGDNCADVEHFKIIGGDHTWPGNFIGGAGTNYDINGSMEIWKFFSKYDINGKIECITDLTRTLDLSNLVHLFPNPAKENFHLNIESKGNHVITISNALGMIVTETTITETAYTFSVKNWDAGLYHIVVTLENGTRAIKRLVVTN